jgi:hypothetical protein
VVELALEWAALAPGLLGELGDAAGSGGHPRRRHQRLLVPAVTYVPAKDMLVGRDPGRLARQRR